MPTRPTPRLVRLNPGAAQERGRPVERDEVVQLDSGPGERLSLEEAFRRHSAAVAGVGFRILGSRSEAEDLVQDVFLRARRWLDRIAEPAALRGLLTVLAVREARYRLRVRRLRAVFRADDSPSYV